MSNILKSLYEVQTTSQKHRNFILEPMGEKRVTDLPGIGELLGKRLESKGFDKAYLVLGQFLVLKKNQKLFSQWLYYVCDANAKQQMDCCHCLEEWCDQFL